MKEYSVELPKKQYKKLTQNIWAKDLFDANLKVDNQTYKIQISLRGNQLRKHKKKSYTILFKEPFLMEGQHEIHLNAEFKDPSLIRNKLSFDFFKQLGVIAPSSKYIFLTINGISQGIYLQLESFDQYFLERYNFPDGTIYYATNDDANFSLYTPEGNLKKTLLDGYTTKYRFQEDDEALKKLLITINTAKKDKFDEEIESLLDIKNYLNWLAGVVCTQNFDGFIHNYALYHNSKTKRFAISPWDYDGTWGRDLHGRSLENEYVPIEGFNTLTARLLDCKRYKNKYAELLREILLIHFTKEHQEKKIEEIHNTIQSYVSLDPYLKDNWDRIREEKDFILNFIEQRKIFIKSKLDNFEN